MTDGSSNLKRTPLFETHRQAGGRLIAFGGWEMPVQYTSIRDEHLAVRERAGLFDISHMGEVRVSGERASEFLNLTLTNDVRKLSVGQGQYTLMCREQGGVIDDLYVYRVGSRDYLMIINAARIGDDLAWLRLRHEAFPGNRKVSLTDCSEQMGAVAVQGPAVAGFIDHCLSGTTEVPSGATRPSEMKKNEVAQLAFGEESVFLGRTGYTGEDGFEIIGSNAILVSLWNDLLEKGRASGLVPAGLGARDTLRTEACLPLYGHELHEGVTPLEAGLKFAVGFEKEAFAGHEVLREQHKNGVKRRCVAFKMTEKSAPPRPHYAIRRAGAEEGEDGGEVTSGTQSPLLGIGIGLGYVPVDWAKPGTEIEIEIRGKRAKAVIAPKPLHRKAV